MKVSEVRKVIEELDSIHYRLEELNLILNSHDHSVVFWTGEERSIRLEFQGNARIALNEVIKSLAKGLYERQAFLTDIFKNIENPDLENEDR